MTALRSTLLALALSGATASEGLADSHSLDCNANGYVLQPDTRYRARETIYLGKSCDAYSDALDMDGRWCWSNAGVVVNYKNGETFAMKMELPTCAALKTASAPCMCQ